MQGEIHDSDLLPVIDWDTASQLLRAAVVLSVFGIYSRQTDNSGAIIPHETNSQPTNILVSLRTAFKLLQHTRIVSLLRFPNPCC